MSHSEAAGTRGEEEQIARDLQLAYEIQAQQEMEYEVDLQHHLSNRHENVPSSGTTERDGAPASNNMSTVRWILCSVGVSLIIVAVVIGLGLRDDEDKPPHQPPQPPPPIFNDYYVGKFPGTVVLQPDEYLLPNQYVACPSGKYRVGMTEEGDLVLEETTSVINATANATNITNITTFSTVERAKTTTTVWKAGVKGGARVRMQDDGNLVIRDVHGESLWSSGTYEHPNAVMIVDDGGRIGVRYKETLIFMDGLPQGVYKGPSSHDLTFPVRGAFYYSWYPKTWTVSSGELARFEPDLGYYVSGEPKVVDSHIDQLEYGNVDVGIISWWGPGTNMDIARITQVMDRTLELNATIKWALYYEDEWKLDPHPSHIQADLEYIQKWFAWHPAYAHVHSKPLIFIWNENECEVVDRWREASQDAWYVIPKLFGGFRKCPVQPETWHQYGPASAYQEFKGYSVSISPGFWHAGESTARLPRLDKQSWCHNVKKMVDSSEPWQLITTFNEAGEGTGIETTSKHWPSKSGYGYYLDCLHDIV